MVPQLEPKGALRKVPEVVFESVGRGGGGLRIKDLGTMLFKADTGNYSHRTLCSKPVKREGKSQLSYMVILKSLLGKIHKSR